VTIEINPYLLAGSVMALLVLLGLALWTVYRWGVEDGYVQGSLGHADVKKKLFLAQHQLACARQDLLMARSSLENSQ
jgi:hypothetical protein